MKPKYHRATVIEIIDTRNIKVLIEEGEEMTASVSGKIRMGLHSKIRVGNEVTIEVSPYDNTRCRLTYQKIFD
ncbi:translation initiation factor IF-1 [Neolewinella persica]|uniref:translation initiation factor IF-1 n=1 Tax=Neolewinella persica TaxID=70998 RepID=UPI00035C59D7